jgi:hypothetical protein
VLTTRTIVPPTLELEVRSTRATSEEKGESGRQMPMLDPTVAWYKRSYRQIKKRHVKVPEDEASAVDHSSRSIANPPSDSVSTSIVDITHSGIGIDELADNFSVGVDDTFEPDFQTAEFPSTEAAVIEAEDSGMNSVEGANMMEETLSEHDVMFVLSVVRDANKEPQLMEQFPYSETSPNIAHLASAQHKDPLWKRKLRSVQSKGVNKNENIGNAPDTVVMDLSFDETYGEMDVVSENPDFMGIPYSVSSLDNSITNDSSSPKKTRDPTTTPMQNIKGMAWERASNTISSLLKTFTDGGDTASLNTSSLWNEDQTTFTASFTTDDTSYRSPSNIRDALSNSFADEENVNTSCGKIQSTSVLNGLSSLAGDVWKDVACFDCIGHVNIPYNNDGHSQQ